MSDIGPLGPIVLCREHLKDQLTVVLEKLWMEPAIPGLQSMWFIHYTAATNSGGVLENEGIFPPPSIK